MEGYEQENIRVAIRIRPPLHYRQLNEPTCVQQKKNTVSIRMQNDVKEFTFDQVFPPQTKQHQIYESCISEYVQSAFAGYNCSILTYGQSATGKSYLIKGVPGDYEKKGMISRVLEEVHKQIIKDHSRTYIVHASYIQIFGQQIFDLFDHRQKRKIKQRRDKQTYVENLHQILFQSPEQMENEIAAGDLQRMQWITMMSANSSRSHLSFNLQIQSQDKQTKTIRTATLKLARLCGSEKIAKTGATGQVLKEAVKIGQSLGSLCQVIGALAQKRKYVPYRDSCLTRLLQQSLGGNARTLIVGTLGPKSRDSVESLCTLRFLNKARNVCNQPRPNQKTLKQEQLDS